VTLLLRSTLILYDLFKEIFKTGNWGVTSYIKDSEDLTLKVSKGKPNS